MQSVTIAEIWETPSFLRDHNCTHVLVTIPGTQTDLSSNGPRTKGTISSTRLSQNFAQEPTAMVFNNTNRSVPATDFYDSLVRQSQRAAAGCWWGVLSTTAVYGNHNGSWVNEESACLVDPNLDPKAQQWMDYEHEWMQRITTVSVSSSPPKKDGTTTNQPPTTVVNIFRCAGIYGPTQSALHTVHQSGQPPSIRSSQENKTTIINSKNTDNRPTFIPVTNRIHQDDVARAVVASMVECWEHTEPELSRNSSSRSKNHVEIYNLADDQPESRQIVLEYAAQLLATIDAMPPMKPNITEKQAKFGARQGRRSRDHKRIDNSKMKHSLLQGRPLLFPTYKEGLQSILDAPGVPWRRTENE